MYVFLYSWYGWSNWCEAKRQWFNWMLTRVPLTLTFDVDLSPWIFKVKLYLRNGRPDCHGTKGKGVDRMPWCETLRKWVNLMLRWLEYLWPWLWHWIFKVKLYLRNERPDCHGMKGTGVDRIPRYETLRKPGVDRMPWCETLRKWVTWMLRWLGYHWPWPLTFNFQGQIVSQEWEASLSWNERDRSH